MSCAVCASRPEGLAFWKWSVTCDWPKCQNAKGLLKEAGLTLWHFGHFG
jgi:hypothetical protein